MKGGGGGVLTSNASEKGSASLGCSNQVDGERGAETGEIAVGARAVSMLGIDDAVSAVASREWDTFEGSSEDDMPSVPTTAPALLTMLRGVSRVSPPRTRVDGRLVSRPRPTGSAAAASPTSAVAVASSSSPKIQFCCRMSDLTMLAACPRLDIDRPKEAGPGGGLSNVLVESMRAN